MIHDFHKIQNMLNSLDENRLQTIQQMISQNSFFNNADQSDFSKTNDNALMMQLLGQQI